MRGTIHARKTIRGSIGYPTLQGEPGEDGYSPQASVTKSGNTATITVTDKSGTTTAQVIDGEKGDPGQDGVSPSATVTQTANGATITITDKTGTTTANVENGEPGHTPVKGTDYWTQADQTAIVNDVLASQEISDIEQDVSDVKETLNDKYEKPSTGIPASDLASGVIPDVSGKADKVQNATNGNFASLDANGNLTDSGHKHSDYLTEVPVTDVQVNGASVLDAQGVAEIPIANVSSKLGLVSVAGNGLTINQYGRIMVQRATDQEIKIGTNVNKPTVPTSQHISAFYGLAKAAGDTTQSSSSNTVGTYTDEAKIAIQKMLGTAGNSDIAYVESSAISQRSYVYGDYFVDQYGILSKATDIIAIGGVLALDTNYVHVGGNGGLANDFLAPATLVADVTVGSDAPINNLSIPLLKPCRHLTIDIQNNNSALPSWSYIRLNRAGSAPALQVNASSTSVKRAYCVIDLINKVGITLLKNSSDSYANAGQITFNSREYIYNTSVVEEIGFMSNAGMIEGFNIKVYGR